MKKKKIFLLLSFIIPFIIMLLFFFIIGCFNNKMTPTSDMFSQSLALYDYYKNLFEGETNFPYTFTKGLGGNMYGTFFYYLSSPLLIFLNFFDDINLFITILIAFKIGLCGITMFTFLQKKMPDNQKIILIFSSAYALMGYNINYYTNIMWLDGIILAPLILLGIENIIKKKKDSLYIITLFLAIFSNYYIGFILVLFSFIYFFYQIYISTSEKKWLKCNKKIIIHFFIVTFLIGGLCSFILLPIAIESNNYIRIINSKQTIINFNFFELFSASYIGYGNLSNPLNEHSFLIYCGTLIYQLVLCYFHDSTICKKNKKAALIVYLTLFLPVIFTPLNYVWHMFTIPQGFNRRYSFLIVLFSIPLAINGLKNMNKSLKKQRFCYYIYFIISLALIYVTIVVPDYFVHNSILNIILTLIMLLINIFLMRKNKIKYLCIVLILELILNLGIIGFNSTLTNKSDYIESKKIISSLNDYCSNYSYRCETNNMITHNNSFIGNYNGITNFLSSTNKKTLDFLYKIRGTENIGNYFKYDNSDPISDMLLGVKYVIVDYIPDDYKLIKQFEYKDKTYYLVENPYALSLGYAVSNKIKSFNSDDLGYEYLQQILNKLNDDNINYIVKLNYKAKDKNEFIIDNSNSYQYIYIYSDIEPIYDGTLHYRSKYGFIIDNSPTITLNYEKEVEYFEIYGLDITKLSQFKNNMTNLNIIENSGNYIKSNITLEEEKTIMTTIPYEKGWNVYIDGKQIEYYEVLDTFIGFDINKGYHEIEFIYKLPGLISGITLSLSSLVLLIIYKIRIVQNK